MVVEQAEELPSFCYVRAFTTLSFIHKSSPLKPILIHFNLVHRIIKTYLNVISIYI
jgi:hypothetical protein